MIDKWMLSLDVKGFDDDQTKAQHQAAKRLVSAVNQYDENTIWVPRLPGPQTLEAELANLSKRRGDTEL